MAQGKKKLLVILNRLVIGGQALDTIPLLYRLQHDFDILILYGCKEKDEAEAIYLLETYNNIPSKPIVQFRRRFNPFRDIPAFFAILRVMHTFRPHIVHTHGAKSGLLGRTASYFSKVPCVVHTFHGHHFHSYFNSFMSQSLIISERLLAKVTTKIIAISASQKQELAFDYRIALPGKIEVIPLGIDEKMFNDEFGNNRSSFREKYCVSQNTIAIGIIGRIVPIKNYDLFVKVAAGIIGKTKQEVKFFVIGDGTEKVYVQNELTRLGTPWCSNDNFVSDAPVIFTSWLPEIAKALYGLDIIILTSHNEGTPMSLIEAQFCGKPVVSTNVGGVRDTFVDNETGFLVAPGNELIFTDKLAQLINNESLRTEMGKKAVAFARENFSKITEANSLRLLYQTCLNLKA
jgi:glycosyltransferase involved in cell wall biosynthesis